MSDLKKDEDYDYLMLKYGFALQKITTELNILLNEYEHINHYKPVDHIKTRIKEKESAIKKLDKKGYEINVDNLQKHVHDMVGVRIICPFLSDVYEIVKIIKKSKCLKIEEEKDYIKNPKKSGYSSYHLIALVPLYLETGLEYIEAEIQIRTMAMDFWASLDHKIQYKYNGIPTDVRQEMYDCAVAIKRLDTKMLNLQTIVSKHKKEK